MDGRLYVIIAAQRNGKYIYLFVLVVALFVVKYILFEHCLKYFCFFLNYSVQEIDAFPHLPSGLYLKIIHLIILH